MNDKRGSWEATEELELKISLFLSQISTKHDVRIKTDSQFDKGRITISIKDAK